MGGILSAWKYPPSTMEAALVEDTYEALKKGGERNATRFLAGQASNFNLNEDMILLYSTKPCYSDHGEVLHKVLSSFIATLNRNVYYKK